MNVYTFGCTLIFAACILLSTGMNIHHLKLASAGDQTIANSNDVTNGTNLMAKEAAFASLLTNEAFNTRTNINESVIKFNNYKDIIMEDDKYSQNLKHMDRKKNILTRKTNKINRNRRKRGLPVEPIINQKADNNSLKSLKNKSKRLVDLLASGTKIENKYSQIENLIVYTEYLSEIKKFSNTLNDSNNCNTWSSCEELKQSIDQLIQVYYQIKKQKDLYNPFDEFEKKLWNVYQNFILNERNNRDNERNL